MHPKWTCTEQWAHSMRVYKSLNIGSITCNCIVLKNWYEMKSYGSFYVRRALQNGIKCWKPGTANEWITWLKWENRILSLFCFRFEFSINKTIHFEFIFKKKNNLTMKLNLILLKQKPFHYAPVKIHFSMHAEMYSGIVVKDRVWEC